MKRASLPDQIPRPHGGGFTLVELLVVIGILIILTTMTLALVNVTQNEDRVRAGAAQVQSYLEGARDRAIHAGAPRGVRFLLDPNIAATDPDVGATSLLYVGAPEIYGEGETISIFRPDTANTVNTSRLDQLILGQHQQAEWDQLVDRDLISSSAQGEPMPTIRMGSSNKIEHYFTIQIKINPKYNSGRRISQSNPKYYYFLTTRYPEGNNAGPHTVPDRHYLLHLNPAVLPNQDPRQLPRGVVIDLENSTLPPAWGGPPSPATTGPPATPAVTYNHLDVLFSPNGTVTGLVASAGVINLVIADQVDLDLNRVPGQSDKEGNERIVSIRTQTGNVSVHYVDPTDSVNNTDGSTGADGKPDDPFTYAARGEVAK